MNIMFSHLGFGTRQRTFILFCESNFEIRKCNRVRLRKLEQLVLINLYAVIEASRFSFLSGRVPSTYHIIQRINLKIISVEVSGRT